MSETIHRSIRSISEDGYKEQMVYYKDIPCGFPDEISDEFVTENKRISGWKHALGQVLVYSFVTGKSPRVVLINENDWESKIPMIQDVYKNYGVVLKIIEDPTIDNPVFDKNKNWRCALKVDRLRFYLSDDGSKKPHLIMRSRTELTLDDLSKPDLIYLAKKKKIPVSNVKKLQLLDKVRASWDDTFLTNLLEESKHSEQIPKTRKDKIKYLSSLGIEIPSKPYFRIPDLDYLIEHPSEETKLSIINKLKCDK